MYVYTRFCFIDLDVYFCVLCLFSGAFLKDSRQSASLFTVCLQDEVVQSDRQAVFEKWNFRSVTESWMQLSAERLCYMSNLDQVHFFFQLGEGGWNCSTFPQKEWSRIWDLTGTHAPRVWNSSGGLAVSPEIHAIMTVLGMWFFNILQLGT